MNVDRQNQGHHLHVGNVAERIGTYWQRQTMVELTNGQIQSVLL